MANKKAATVPDFEGTLKKLEALVEQMEGGELTLEQALKSFEEGVGLVRHCQQALCQAELKVEELMAEKESGSFSPAEE